MSNNNKKVIGGSILPPSEKSVEFVSRKNIRNESKSLVFHLTDENPSPIMRIHSSGKIIYANNKADQLLAGLSPEDHGLQLYRLGVLVNKAIKNQAPLRFQYNINNADYRIEVLPVDNLEEADLYFIEISESVKIKNYFEVQAAFAEALLKAESINDVVWSIVKQAISRLGYEDCVVYLLDDDGVTLWQVAAHGPKNPRDNHLNNPIALRLGKGIAGNVAQNKVGEIVNDVSKDPRYVVDDESRLSEIAVPILDGDQLIGVIDSEHQQRNYYTSEDLSILNAIASMAGTKIQRIRSNEAIITEQQKTKSLINNAFGGIYTLRGRRFEMVNRVFKEITGYSERELTAQNFDMTSLIFNIEEEGQKAMDSRAKGDYSRKSYQIEIKTKIGHLKRLAINTVILEDEKGPYTLGVALDISPLLESERKLKLVNEELSSRNEELKQFAHLASHNLRAPVSNMLGLLDIYEKGEGHLEQNEMVISALNKAVTDLNSTLEDMHYVLKMRANEEHDFEQISLNDVLERTCSLLIDEIEHGDIEITHHFEQATFKYVRYHVDNFFLNMVSNAIKYRNKTKQSKLHIGARALEDGIELTFEDNGLGIDLERHRKDLFGMYKRFHDQPHGRGIGLYLVHTQLLSLGGSIDVVSTVGKGTTFKLHLKCL